MKVSSSWTSILALAILIVIVITGLQIFFNINSKVIQIKEVKTIDPAFDLTIISKMSEHKSLLVHTY